MILFVILFLVLLINYMKMTMISINLIKYENLYSNLNLLLIMNIVL